MAKVWALKKQGKRAAPHTFVLGVMLKILVSSLILLGFILFEQYIGKFILEAFDMQKFYLLPTRAVASFFLTTDFLSIDRHYHSITGVSFIKGFKKFIKDLIDFKKRINE